MEETFVYVMAIVDSLNKKVKVVEKLWELTREQGEILEQRELREQAERFDEIIQDKEDLLRELEGLDRGFETAFAKVGETMKREKDTYRTQILQMQNAIRSITETGLKIEGQEKKNRDAFQNYAKNARKEIREFQASNKTANTYYQNMASQHHEWQTYFMDQKK